MPPRLAKKPLNTYHHGDLRDALVQAGDKDAAYAGFSHVRLRCHERRAIAHLLSQAGALQGHKL